MDTKHHLAVDRKLLGREFEDVHEYIDESFYEEGILHRLNRHGPITAFKIAREKGVRAGVSAALHHLSDILTVFPVPLFPLYRETIEEQRNGARLSD
jgi:hypothetical protein|tara:strand:- start:3845 stop:4135 length:291 start_codon:yes stop_codon:yes gene_type:complete